ncbi:MAG: hypothetical protein WDW38_006576 [Sanguina aurantia]
MASTSLLSAAVPAVPVVAAPDPQPNVNCLELRTIQSCAFKVLMEALKELLTDTCMKFDETGLKIVSTDTSHVVLVYLRLDASKFEYYHCPKPMSIGVNMLNLHKLIKTINNNDTLTLFVDSEDTNHLGIKIENNEKNTKTTYKLNLLEFDDPDMTAAPANFKTVMTLPSSDFQKICRDMHNLADVMEIKSIKNKLIFGCKGDFCSQETVLTDDDSGGKGFFTRHTSQPSPLAGTDTHRH